MNPDHLKQPSTGPSQHSAGPPPSRWPLVQSYTTGYPHNRLKSYGTLAAANIAWQLELARRNLAPVPPPVPNVSQADLGLPALVSPVALAQSGSDAPPQYVSQPTPASQIDNPTTESCASTSLSEESQVEGEDWWVLLEGDRPGPYASRAEVFKLCYGWSTGVKYWYTTR
ncbi:hypothetical protein BDN72DRAFT_863122 [Pluteus cervinus]|uniref:Uncharacterized protein n=1 Tax=Pluteus cervinus TaxID=181527 RepID=A0ACD3A8Z4_9AGAR|nr:hypothetical protein BDN72DRAFT_863122 [Pluteus cervinus]